jgi:hypothetical protein
LGLLTSLAKMEEKIWVYFKWVLNLDWKLN